MPRKPIRRSHEYLNTFRRCAQKVAHAAETDQIKKGARGPAYPQREHWFYFAFTDDDEDDGREEGRNNPCLFLAYIDATKDGGDSLRCMVGTERAPRHQLSGPRCCSSSQITGKSRRIKISDLVGC